MPNIQGLAITIFAKWEWNHYYADKGQTSSLENLGYDIAGFAHPYVGAAVLLPSLANTRKDWANGYIDDRRAIFNVTTDVIGSRSPVGSGASAFANAMDYADEKGWLDSINSLMSSD